MFEIMSKKFHFDLLMVLRHNTTQKFHQAGGRQTPIAVSSSKYMKI